MNGTDYSLTKLWPEFGRILQGDVTSAEGLSALFVLVLAAFVVFFALLSVWNYWRAHSHLKFYRVLLKDLTAEQLLEKENNRTATLPIRPRIW